MNIDLGLLISATATLVASVTFASTLYQERRSIKTFNMKAKELQEVKDSAALEVRSCLPGVAVTALGTYVSNEVVNDSLGSVVGTEPDASRFRPLSANRAFLAPVFLSSAFNIIAASKHSRLFDDVIQPYPDPYEGRMASIAKRLKVSKRRVPLPT